MNIKGIVKKYLQENGYDCIVADGCSCSLDELMPCNTPFNDCVPGHNGNCLDCEYSKSCVRRADFGDVGCIMPGKKKERT